MADALNFDAYEPKSVPVKYRGEEYELREADGDTAIAFKNVQTKGAKLSEGKIVADLGNLAESVPVLVGGCLHKDGKPVGPKFARSLPNVVLEALYDAALSMSDLGGKKSEPDYVKAAFEANKALTDFRRKQQEESSDPKEQPENSTDGSE